VEYKPTATSAIEFSKANQLEEWIHLFLCGEGNNKAFSDGLKREPRLYYPPEKMRLDQFVRCCGPEEGMEYPVPEDSFRERVEGIVASYQTGKWDMPPLIVNRDENGYTLNDGSHRFEALGKMGIEKHWVIIWETETIEGDN
jgi:hypothetical protein